MLAVLADFEIKLVRDLSMKHHRASKFYVQSPPWDFIDCPKRLWRLGWNVLDTQIANRKHRQAYEKIADPRKPRGTDVLRKSVNALPDASSISHVFVQDSEPNNRVKRESRVDLTIEHGIVEDNSVVVLSRGTMDLLQLTKNDVIWVRTNSRETMLVAIVNSKAEDGKAHLGRIVRQNLGVERGDQVSLRHCNDVRFAERVVVTPKADKSDSELCRKCLFSYFSLTYRPVTKGDLFSCTTGSETLNFEVAEVAPSGYGVMCPDTILFNACAGDESGPVASCFKDRALF